MATTVTKRHKERNADLSQSVLLRNHEV